MNICIETHEKCKQKKFWLAIKSYLEGIVVHLTSFFGAVIFFTKLNVIYNFEYPLRGQEEITFNSNNTNILGIDIDIDINNMALNHHLWTGGT